MSCAYKEKEKERQVTRLHIIEMNCAVISYKPNLGSGKTGQLVQT